MTDREFIEAELQKLQKILEDKADEYISFDNWNKATNLLSFATACSGALELLKEQEVRELTIDEWREWKNNPKRNPICMLWEHDTSPMWILNPNDVHEPALLMGKLKLFTGKPSFEQCKEVKWDD